MQLMLPGPGTAFALRVFGYGHMGALRCSWFLSTVMPPQLRLNAVAFVSPQNHPILIRTFVQVQDELKYHYIAHTSLDVIDERSASLLAS